MLPSQVGLLMMCPLTLPFPVVLLPMMGVDGVRGSSGVDVKDFRSRCPLRQPDSLISLKVWFR